jgi:hypothetical protein
VLSKSIRVACFTPSSFQCCAFRIASSLLAMVVKYDDTEIQLLTVPILCSVINVRQETRYCLPFDEHSPLSRCEPMDENDHSSNDYIVDMDIQPFRGTHLGIFNI